MIHESSELEDSASGDDIIPQSLEFLKLRERNTLSRFHVDTNAVNKRLSSFIDIKQNLRKPRHTNVHSDPDLRYQT